MKFYRLIITYVLFLLFFANSFSNAQPTRKEARLVQAFQEVDLIFSEADTLNNPLEQLKIKAKALDLKWQKSPEDAKALLLSLWSWLQQQDSNLEKTAGQNEILKVFYKRDAQTADQLLKSLDLTKSAEQGKNTKSMPIEKRLANLAADLVDQDVALAASLIEKSLSTGYTPLALTTLQQLREQDANLADQLAIKAFNILSTHETFRSLQSIYTMFDYAYPAAYQIGATNGAIDESLRKQYFNAAYNVLIKSAIEDEKGKIVLSSAEAKTRQTFQGLLSPLVLALAARFSPDKTAELGKVMVKYTPNLPPSITPLVASQLARAKGESLSFEKKEGKNTLTEIQALLENDLAKEDYVSARSRLDSIEDEKMKKSLEQIIVKVEFRNQIAKGNLAAALQIARKIEDAGIKAHSFGQVARFAYKKKETEFCRLILAEAKNALTDDGCDAKSVRALFSLVPESVAVSDPNTIETLQKSISCLNMVVNGSDELIKKKDRMARFSTPVSLADANELRLAFSSYGSVDFEKTLLQATAIDNKLLNLTARLAACEKVIDTLGFNINEETRKK